MKILELISAIEVFAAPGLQEDYDNAGLITGHPSWECTGVLCTLDVTLTVVQEALQRGCNLILAHHPILFKGLKRLNGNNYVEQVIIAAVKNDIAIYAAHTNLDNVLPGVSGKMAEKLNLKNSTTLQPKNKLLRKLTTFAPENAAAQVRQSLFAAGAGHIGNYSECSFNTNGVGTFKALVGAQPYIGEVGKQHHEAETKIEMIFPFYVEQQVVKALTQNHPYEEVAYDIVSMENAYPQIGSGVIGYLENEMDEQKFLQLLKQTFFARGIRHTALLNKPVKKVALCGGAGSFLIKTARQQGADVYITADVKYHEFFDAEGQMMIADIGHYESEQFTVELLHGLLVEKFPTFAVLKSGVETNPVLYL